LHLLKSNKIIYFKYKFNLDKLKSSPFINYNSFFILFAGIFNKLAEIAVQSRGFSLFFGWNFVLDVMSFLFFALFLTIL
jgi:hypothetical protein